MVGLVGPAELGEVVVEEGPADAEGVYHAVKVIVTVATAQAEPAGPEPEPGAVYTGAAGVLELEAAPGPEPDPGAV
jgi:hypothetical protein